MPVHDAGVRAALALLDGTRLPAIDLAWSPNGRRLAVTPSDVAATSVSVPELTVYDCASGRVRLQFSVADLVPVLREGQPLSAMAWSPDSTHLLLVPLGQRPRIQVLGLTSLGG
jgi:hypothetical protein